MTQWNPRYELWAKLHNLSPEDMGVKDQEDWPGGCMTGFSLWIQEKWSKWAKEVSQETGEYYGEILKHLNDKDNKNFDTWLQEEVSKEILAQNARI